MTTITMSDAVREVRRPLSGVYLVADKSVVVADDGFVAVEAYVRFGEPWPAWITPEGLVALDPALYEEVDVRDEDSDEVVVRVRLVRGITAADLHDYNTAAFIRPATPAEAEASRKAAESDGGAGVIRVDGRSCYVVD